MWRTDDDHLPGALEVLFHGRVILTSGEILLVTKDDEISLWEIQTTGWLIVPERLFQAGGELSVLSRVAYEGIVREGWLFNFGWHYISVFPKTLSDIIKLG
jgi:hypothetical protein